MSKNNLELTKWGNGTIQIALWNSATGHDVFFNLKEDGTAERREYGEGEDEVIVTPIENLVLALREFTEEIPKLLEYEED